MKVKHLGGKLYTVSLSADQQCVVDRQAEYSEVDIDIALEQIISAAIDPYVFICKEKRGLESVLRSIACESLRNIEGVSN